MEEEVLWGALETIVVVFYIVLVGWCVRLIIYISLITLVNDGYNAQESAMKMD